MSDLRQDDFKIEMVGTVVPPPTVGEVVARICDAADRKQSLTLSPAELRVLSLVLPI